MMVERWKATFIRPAGCKVRIPIVPGGKMEIPKSPGHIPCTTGR